jgi:U3 small nucleolar RNA-associated protein 25
MQSLAAENAAPKAKRRKLDHLSETTVVKDNEKNGQNELDIAEDVDRVDEAEEGPETATDGFLEGDEAEEAEDASDPFESHFANPNDNVLARRLKSVQLNQWSTQKLLLPKVGRALINIPQDEDTSKKSPSSISGPGQLNLKQKLADIAQKLRPSFNDLEIAIAPLIFNYQDVLYCQRSPANSENLRRLTCLHAVNHVFK